MRKYRSFILFAPFNLLIHLHPKPPYRVARMTYSAVKYLVLVRDLYKLTVCSVRKGGD